MLVPTPMSPPGTANLSWFFSASSETIREKIGWHLVRPSASLVMTPGRTSISCPNRSTPVKIEPPATPPFSSSTSAPGLLTSKERMTISFGEEAKSRGGTGMFLTRYSLIASMLYLS